MHTIGDSLPVPHRPCSSQGQVLQPYNLWRRVVAMNGCGKCFQQIRFPRPPGTGWNGLGCHSAGRRRTERDEGQDRSSQSYRIPMANGQQREPGSKTQDLRATMNQDDSPALDSSTHGTSRLLSISAVQAVGWLSQAQLLVVPGD